MKWTVTIYEEEYVPHDEAAVSLERKEHIFECPFECGQKVYYAYLERHLFRKDKWVVRKSRIVGIWATNIYGVILDNSEQVYEGSFDLLFTNRNNAIDFCLKKNMQFKVKIYNE